jgi:hypothetical protein
MSTAPTTSVTVTGGLGVVGTFMSTGGGAPVRKDHIGDKSF